MTVQLFVTLLMLGLGMVLICAQELVRFKKLISFVMFFNGLLLTAYLVANRLTGNGIDESVLYHIMMGLGGAGYSQFAIEFLLALFGVVGSVLLAAYWPILCAVLRLSALKHSLRSSRTGISLLLIATLVNPASLNVMQLLSALQPAWITDNKAAVRPDTFVLQPIVSERASIKPKNILYVYLESLERTYFDETVFPNLVPNLKRLERQAVTFTHIDQPIATGWTIAGMVASQCGMPLFTARQGNSMGGLQQFLPQVSCLGDVLKARGYELHYMGGAEVSFGGKRRFYESHGFDSIQGVKTLQVSSPQPLERNSWGLYDDNLLPMVVERFSTLHARQEPFGLFTLSLDTHGPDGFVSPSCRDHPYGDGGNPILNSVHCTDQLLGEFINQILHIDSDNTLIVISSDHLALPNTATTLLERGSRKNLFMVLGANQDPAIHDSAGTIFDVAPTLLHFLGSEGSRIGFGRDLMFDSTEPTTESMSHEPAQSDPYKMASMELVDVNRVIENSRDFFYRLWSFPNLDAGFSIHITDLNLKFADNKEIDYPVLILLDASMRIENLFFQASLAKTLLSVVRGLDPYQNFLWVDECDSLIWLDSPALSQTEVSQQDALWCVAYGSLASDAIKVRPLPGDSDVTSQELADFFALDKRRVTNVLVRLSRLQELIAEKHLPAH